MYNQLYGSFILDNSKTNMTLNFEIPYSIEYGIREMVQWYISLKR